MPIYEKSTKEIMITEYFKKINLKLGQVLERQDIVDWFKENYPKINSNTVVCHLAKLSVNDPSRKNWYLNKDGKDDILFKLSANTFRLYDKINDVIETEIYNSETINEENLQEFAYEKDLQNFLVKNLHIIEDGLKLYEEDGITGVEYYVGGKRIDILALDKNYNFVVIELKVSRGYDRVIGQLLRYKNWIKENLTEEGQKVRGIIICKDITEDLRLACLDLKDIDLFEYEISVKLHKKN